MKEFRGTYAVTLTPFDEKDQVDEGKIRGHVDFLVQNGIHGIICTGSTGEFASLSDDERKRVIQVTVEQTKRRVPVLAGASANSSKDVIRYCTMAEKLGVDGVMLVHPYYCRPSQSELYEHYKYVAEHVNLPIMVYNNPLTSGVDIMPETLARLSSIDNIQYVKECSGDARRPGEILRLCGDRLRVFAGSDDIFLEAFLQGSTGWVCGASNVLPRETAEIFELAVEKADLLGARDYAEKMMSFFFMVETEGCFVQYLKAGMELIGRPMGDPRRPLLPVSKETKHRMKIALAKARSRSLSSVGFKTHRRRKK